MSAYVLLCNFTDQGVKGIKDVPKRRAAARELGKSLGVEIKSGHLALGAYDLILHAEAASDEAMAEFVLSGLAEAMIHDHDVWRDTPVFGMRSKFLGSGCYLGHIHQ
jgi:uncharacterized protein with GYD domain